MRFTRLLRLGAGAGHGHGGATFHGFKEPHAAPVYKHIATGIGAAMWFWLFYRAKHDGAAFIGLHHPWEGHGHGDHGHEEHH